MYSVAVKETDQESDDSKEDEKKKKAGPKPAAIYKLVSSHLYTCSALYLAALFYFFILY